MSEHANEWDEDFDGDDRQSDNPIKALRKIERQQKVQIKELTEELEQMKAQVRERSVKDVLASKGLNDKISKFIPTDMTSVEAIEGWVVENSEIFGVTPDDAADAQQSTGTQDDQAQALQRISASQAQGAAPTSDPDQVESLIKAASNPEELNRLLFGNADGPNVA